MKIPALLLSAAIVIGAAAQAQQATDPADTVPPPPASSNGDRIAQEFAKKMAEQRINMAYQQCLAKHIQAYQAAGSVITSEDQDKFDQDCFEKTHSPEIKAQLEAQFYDRLKPPPPPTPAQAELQNALQQAMRQCMDQIHADQMQITNPSAYTEALNHCNDQVVQQICPGKGGTVLTNANGQGALGCRL